VSEVLWLVDSDSLLRALSSFGAGAELEVYVEERVGGSVLFERGEFKDAEAKNAQAVIVRCLASGKMATVRSNQFSANGLETLFARAYKLASKAGSTDCQGRLSTYSVSKGVDPYCEETAHTDLGELSKRVSEAIKVVGQTRKVYSVNAEADYGVRRVAAANTNGVSGDWMTTHASVSAEVVARDEGEQASGWKVSESNSVDELGFESVVSGAAELAVSLLGARPAPTFKGQLLTHPYSSCLLVSSFAEAMSGEEVLKGRSFLSGKKGSKVASDRFVLREDNSLPKRPYSRGFDDELVPTHSKYLVQNGELKTYLHNLYSAERSKEEPTGNGFRDGADIAVGATNIVVEPGSEKPPALLDKVERGIYLIRTGDTPNMSTGDLSAMVSMGYYVDKGEILYPVKETMVGVNVLSLLRNVLAVGSDAEALGRTISPSLLFDGVSVSGKQT
jgi:predicted Zn-dependent protease